MPLLTMGAIGVSAPLQLGVRPVMPPAASCQRPFTTLSRCCACLKLAGWVVLSHFTDGETEACSCSRSFTGSPRP